MKAKLIDGRQLGQEIRAEVAQEVLWLRERYGVTPGLAAVLVGDNPASAVYVRSKSRACREVGIFTETFHLNSDTTQADLETLIHTLGRDERFHGILVQLPLPKHINPQSCLLALDPNKDVDGLHPMNVGRLVSGTPLFVPCTPAGIQQMLLRSGFNPDGKHMVICGRSAIVGKPLAILMTQKYPGANATVTICHTGTRDLGEITRQADILVAATGYPATLTADMVREGVVVIDVGVNRVEDSSREKGYRLVGDVEFDGVAEKAAAISPVPGGVGPMTIAMLLVNTMHAARLRLGVEDG